MWCHIENTVRCLCFRAITEQLLQLSVWLLNLILWFVERGLFKDRAEAKTFEETLPVVVILRPLFLWGWEFTTNADRHNLLYSVVGRREVKRLAWQIYLDAQVIWSEEVLRCRSLFRWLKLDPLVRAEWQLPSLADQLLMLVVCGNFDHRDVGFEWLLQVFDRKRVLH